MSSLILSPSNFISFIKINCSFSTSSIICGICLPWTIVSPLATSAAFIASLFFMKVEIVNFAILYCAARSDTRAPLSNFAIISFFNSIVVLTTYLFSFTIKLLLLFLGLKWPYVKKKTQNHEHYTVRSTRHALSCCSRYTEHATPRVLLIRLDSSVFGSVWMRSNCDNLFYHQGIFLPIFFTNLRFVRLTVVPHP